jgi:uncharacterized protein (TIGR03000 family)
MARKLFGSVGVTALTAVALLVAPTAYAQHGGHGGGGHMGGGFHGGSFHGGSFHHENFHHGNFHHGFVVAPFGGLWLGLGGLGWYGYPYYGGYYGGGYYGGDYGYSTYPNYAYTIPDYSYATSSVGVTTQPYVPSYPATTAPATPPATSESAYRPAGGAAQISVRVPSDATLWVNGYQSTQTGPVRQLVTPNPLEPGKTYHYTLRARWLENGQTVTREQDVKFKAGDDVNVDLTGKNGS